MSAKNRVRILPAFRWTGDFRVGCVKDPSCRRAARESRRGRPCGPIDHALSDIAWVLPPGVQAGARPLLLSDAPGWVPATVARIKLGHGSRIFFLRLARFSGLVRNRSLAMRRDIVAACDEWPRAIYRHAARRSACASPSPGEPGDPDPATAFAPDPAEAIVLQFSRGTVLRMAGDGAKWR